MWRISGKCSRLLGYSAEKAAAAAKTVMTIETALAKGVAGPCRPAERQQSESSRYDEGLAIVDAFLPLDPILRKDERCRSSRM